jgi:hypothetical protein
LVEPDEIDVQLDELELRVDRLRALYEQYFMGLEKVEPAVPRKDVDRRIWVLRRTQIRNTARRFRLQNIIQRYNTFQQYWQRICREIENGTYTRHLMRAVKRLGENEALTIAARRRFGRQRLGGDAGRSSYPAPSVADVEAELQAELRRLSEPPKGGDDVDDLFRNLVSSAPPLLPLVGSFSSPPVALSLPARPPGSRPLPKPVVPPPIPSRAPASPALSVRAAPAAPVQRPSVPGRAIGRPGGPVPGPLPALRPPPIPSRAPGPAPVPPVPSPGPVGLWVAPGDPMARRRAQLPSAAPAERRELPACAALDERQLNDLHSRLLRARDQTGDKTHVSVEALAKTVDSAATKLRQQHGQHRRVEFEVVIKDGKAVVRPIVR